MNRPFRMHDLYQFTCPRCYKAGGEMSETVCFCPSCRSDLRSAPIPESSRQFYSQNSTHFVRLIAIYDTGLDRTTSWRCPDCGYECQSRDEFNGKPVTL